MKLSTLISRYTELFADKIGSFANNSKKVFSFALFSGIILSLLSVIFIHDMYRDVAAVYAYYAREISWGNYQAGWVGRVPMLHIMLSGVLAKVSGLEAFRACVAVSSLFFVLTIFPLRKFLERFTTPVSSAWGCVLFIFAPKVIRFSVAGLLDSGRYFFLMLGLLYFFRSTDKQIKLRYPVILGVTLALLAVSRGEELLISLAMLAGFPVFLLLKQWKKFPKSNYKKYLAAWLLMIVFFIAGLLPFCYGNWKYYNWFVPDLRLKEFVNYNGINKVSEESRSQDLLHKANDLGFAPQEKYDPVKNILNTLKDTSRGAYEIYLLFSVIGAVTLLRKKKWNWELTMICGIFLIHFVIYDRIVSAYRYSIYLVPMFMPFTVTGLKSAGEKISQRLKKLSPEKVALIQSLFAVAVVILFVYQATNGMKCVTDRKDKKFHRAAEFIKNYAAENFPGRRCRIAAVSCAETIYHTGAEAWWGYKKTELSPAQHKRENFDLFLLDKKQNPELLELIGNLQEIPTPENFPVRIFKKAESF